MKILAPLLLCLAATACDAQNKAPVNVAFELYRGCIRGTLDVGHYPETVEEVPGYVDSLDKLCMDWTVAWYPAMATNRDARRPLTDDELHRLDARRENMLADITKDLLIEVWTKK